MFTMSLLLSILSMVAHVQCSVFNTHAQNLIEKFEKFRAWKEIYANSIQSYYGCINMLYADL